MGITSTAATVFSTAALEESARDRKNQLESMIAELKKMATHLYIMTDEELGEYDVWDS